MSCSFFGTFSEIENKFKMWRFLIITLSRQSSKFLIVVHLYEYMYVYLLFVYFIRMFLCFFQFFFFSYKHLIVDDHNFYLLYLSNSSYFFIIYPILLFPFSWLSNSFVSHRQLLVHNFLWSSLPAFTLSRDSYLFDKSPYDLIIFNPIWRVKLNF